MAITKETEISKIEVVGPFKHVQVRIDTVIKEDGTEITRKHSRKIFESGHIDASKNWVDTDMSSEDAEIKAVANAVWTNDVKNSFKAHQIALHDKLGA